MPNAADRSSARRSTIMVSQPIGRWGPCCSVVPDRHDQGGRSCSRSRTAPGVISFKRQGCPVLSHRPAIVGRRRGDGRGGGRRVAPRSGGAAGGGRGAGISGVVWRCSTRSPDGGAAGSSSRCSAWRSRWRSPSGGSPPSRPDGRSRGNSGSRPPRSGSKAISAPRCTAPIGSLVAALSTSSERSRRRARYSRPAGALEGNRDERGRARFVGRAVGVGWPTPPCAPSGGRLDRLAGDWILRRARGPAPLDRPAHRQWRACSSGPTPPCPTGRAASPSSSASGPKSASRCTLAALPRTASTSSTTKSPPPPGPRLLFSVQPVPPEQGTAKQARLRAWEPRGDLARAASRSPVR